MSARSRNQRSGVHTSSAGPGRRRRVALVVGGILVVGAGITALSWRMRPHWDPAVPTNLSQLKPQLVELIQTHVQHVQESPGSATAVATLGLVYEANGLLPQARQCYDRAATLAPQEPLWLLHAAITCRESGDALAALDLLQAHGDRFTGHSALQHLLGVLLMDAGEFDAARAAFERARAALQDSPVILADLGDLALRENRTEQALSLLERAVALAPEYGTARHLLGLAYTQAGRPDKAREHLLAGVGSARHMLADAWSEQRPRYEVGTSNRVERALKLISLERYAEAERALQSAREQDPRNTTVLVNLGIAQLGLGQLDQAHRTLMQAHECDPSYALVHVNLAAVRKEMGDAAAALSSIDRAIELDPGFARGHLLRGRILNALRKPTEALEALRVARRLEPGNLAVLHDLARTCTGMQQFTEAQEVLTELARLMPGSWEAAANLCFVSIQLGDRPAASRALNAARNLAPDEPRIESLAKQVDQLN